MRWDSPENEHHLRQTLANHDWPCYPRLIWIGVLKRRWSSNVLEGHPLVTTWVMQIRRKIRYYEPSIGTYRKAVTRSTESKKLETPQSMEQKCAKDADAYNPDMSSNLILCICNNCFTVGSFHSFTISSAQAFNTMPGSFGFSQSISAPLSMLSLTEASSFPKATFHWNVEWIVISLNFVVPLRCTRPEGNVLRKPRRVASFSIDPVGLSFRIRTSSICRNGRSRILSLRSSSVILGGGGSWSLSGVPMREGAALCSWASQIVSRMSITERTMFSWTTARHEARSCRNAYHKYYQWSVGILWIGRNMVTFGECNNWKSKIERSIEKYKKSRYNWLTLQSRRFSYHGWAERIKPFNLELHTRFTLSYSTPLRLSMVPTKNPWKNLPNNSTLTGFSPFFISWRCLLISSSIALDRFCASTSAARRANRCDEVSSSGGCMSLYRGSSSISGSGCRDENRSIMVNQITFSESSSYDKVMMISSTSQVARCLNREHAVHLDRNGG